MDFNSQNSEKTLRVGIIGPKRVGKDHFRNAVFPDFLRASIGDVLKELSVSPEYEGTMGHDSRYLEKDFAQCLENPELLARVAAILAKDGLPEGFAISWSSFDTKESRQALMDAYKNFPEELRTRKALQHF